MRSILYTNQLTARLQYIIGVLFTKDLVVTDSTETFIAFDGFKLNYSESPIAANECWVNPHGLLAATTIQEQNIECAEWEGLPIFLALHLLVSLLIFYLHLFI